MLAYHNLLEELYIEELLTVVQKKPDIQLYDLACQEYNKYGEANGLLTTKQAEQIAIADGCDPDTSEFLVYIDELFTQDMQDHISYYIIPTSEDTKVKEIKELKILR